MHPIDNSANSFHPRIFQLHYNTRAVHTHIIIVLTVGHGRSTATIPAARIDPPKTGAGNYA